MSNPIKVIKLTGVSGSLEGKADVNHDHVLADINDAGSAAAADTADFATADQGTKADNAIQAGSLASINADITDATLIDTTDPRLSDARTPTSHPHTLSEITDSGTAAGLDVPTVGNAAASEVVKGNDSRLSDDRDPTAHIHTLSDISDSGTAAAADTTDFATAAQGTLATTALQDPTAFATAAQGDLADTALQDATAFAAVSHTHPLSEITDNNIVVRTTDSDVSSTSWVLDEDTLASNSTTKVPTQASVKSYVDNEILQIDIAQSFKGAYNASTNTPDLTTPAAVIIAAGDTYIVDTEGTFYSQTLKVGSTIIAEVDSASSESDWTLVTTSNDAAAIKQAYESNADTNAFTDVESLKLLAIEEEATADQTGAEIKIAYELEPNTNAFTDDDASAVEDVINGEYTRNDQSSVVSNSWVVNDPTMSSASSQLPTSSSIKSYVDSSIASIEFPEYPDLVGSMTLKGDYDATQNVPDLDGSLPREPIAYGDAYVISVGGSLWGQSVEVGTLIIAKTDNPSSLSGWYVILGGGTGVGDTSGILDITNEPLGDLNDVNLANVSTGQTLQWDGSSWVNGNGVSVTVDGPSAPADPADGDLWYDTHTGILYVYYIDDNSEQWVATATQGPQGATGPVGPTGPPDAYTILNGTVVPTTEGQDGDFYIKTDTSDIYGPKTGGSWGSPVSLIGPRSYTILNSTSIPTTEGQDGDFYIKTDTSQIYGPKTAGSWGTPTSLIGPQGPTGESIKFKGTLPSAGNLPTTGATIGDTYMTDDDKIIHIYDGSSFVSGVPLGGPEGPEGPEGPRGGASYTVVGSVLTITNDNNADFQVSGSTLIITTS